MQNIAISVQQVAKDYGDFRALKTVSLDIREGEFFTLLGPSGCGKTTLLKLLGGFEQTTAGSIHLFGEEIEKLPANRRPINTVFQQYALFPHMTIHENVQFGMKMLGVGKAEREQRATEMLAMVQLEKFAHRRPAELSGGQQQRVALARALAPRPRVLLLDEPLSALDLKLRQAMRSELKQIQQQTGITFVFVTHDQEEALTMSDRIVVLNGGKVEQVGTPDEIYHTPASLFVSEFIGESNIFCGEVIQTNDDGCLIDSQGIAVYSHDGNLSVGQDVTLLLRPEHFRLVSDNAPADNSKQQISATLQQSVFIGRDHQLNCTLDNGTEITALIRGSLPDLKSGDRILLEYDIQSVHTIPQGRG
ncbi:ABC transporter ATP-binding protein [Thalassolituus sp. UBA1505]|uniref:ABC transporter ATP-binding protein n=1 Tax=Thalassolituus sp. UBA1505 TaxID=1947653 RepID=UPI0025EB1374|nr:ABC transporter ATP-binding protein [Thalassolituus sp. UBA1505]